MALSEREQKVLEEMAQQINTEDPEFATQMSFSVEQTHRKFSAKNIVAGVLLAVVGLGVVLTGVTLKMIWLGVAGFILIALGAFWATKRTSQQPRNAKQGHQVAASAQKSSGGFMQNLENKWDERRRQ